MKNSFTLSEVLITLVVIGIIAAITVPLIMTNYQKQEVVSKFKKVYSTLANGIKLAVIDNGGPTKSWNQIQDSEKYFNNYIRPYYNIMRRCSGNDCGYEEPWKGTLMDFYIQPGTNNNTPSLEFFLNDGTFIKWIYGIPGDDSPWIFVDINGLKGPNKVGRDIFSLEFENNGEYVSSSGEACNKDMVSANSDVVQVCSNKIINDGWEIKDDYPW